MTTIALEDLVTIVCTEFVKQEQHKSLRSRFTGDGVMRFDYLKMNNTQRRKISEKLLKSLEKY